MINIDVILKCFSFLGGGGVTVKKMLFVMNMSECVCGMGLTLIIQI